MEIVNTKRKTKQKYNRKKPSQKTHQYLCEVYREYSMWKLITRTYTHAHAHTRAHKQQHNTKTCESNDYMQYPF